MSLQIDLIDEIASNHLLHSRTTKWWEEQNQNYFLKFSEEFEDSPARLSLGSAGEVTIENINFGSIRSVHLFGLDELIIFAWYQVNSNRYKKTLDLGANIGVHSMLMSKFGFQVTAYEPDPRHIELFKETMQANSVQGFNLRKKAIGVSTEKSNFTRVLGNTTGSHLSGAKSDPYGELEVFEVDVDSFLDVISERFDFIKMDVEGYEAKLISKLRKEDLHSTEIMLEIGTKENASKIYNEIIRLELNAFSQKNNWRKIETLSDLPISHREGSLFLTTSPQMNWMPS